MICDTFYDGFLLLNTLHNSKRLGPFLGFGFNFCGKQDEYLKTDKFGQTSYTLFNSNNK